MAYFPCDIFLKRRKSEVRTYDFIECLYGILISFLTKDIQTFLLFLFVFHFLYMFKWHEQKIIIQW